MFLSRALILETKINALIFISNQHSLHNNIYCHSLLDDYTKFKFQISFENCKVLMNCLFSIHTILLLKLIF